MKKKKKQKQKETFSLCTTIQLLINWGKEEENAEFGHPPLQ
jgi:hypothetical protein